MDHRFRHNRHRPVFADLALLALSLLAVLLWLAPFWTFADLFRQLWPLWAVAAIIVFSWTVGRRLPRRRVAMILAVAILLPGLGSVWAGIRPGNSLTPPSGQLITFASHNLWGRNRAHELTIDVLRQIDADILAMQEAGVRTRAIQEALGDHYPYEATCHRAPVRIYSRLPIVESGCLRDVLDANRSLGDPAWRWDFPASNWARMARPDGQTFVVVNVHFTWPNPLSLQDQERINFAEIVQLFDQDSLVILGDFNAAIPSAALARFDRDLDPIRRTHSLATWPSQGRWTDGEGNTPPLPTMFAGIDHIYAGENWFTESVNVGPNTGSDHRPFIGRMILTDRNN